MESSVSIAITGAMKKIHTISTDAIFIINYII